MTHSAEPEEAVSASFAARWLARPVVWLGGAVSAVLILAVLGVTIYSIFMRYVMNRPLLWADEVTGWALVAMVMLGAAEAYRRGDHIAIDLVSARLTGRARQAAAVIADAAVLAFAVVVAISTWDAISFARMFGSYTTGEIVLETWILQAPILVGSLLLALMAVIRLIERATGYRRV
ncbi:MAG: TRAP transporter small permease [Alphaproteobacteria bacterium]|nr:MAG: TRAP transporter small permease [Alphaproteobacteria bacterium]